jgi:hypothetical protein
MTTLIVATIVMQQPTCFWRISNLGDNNIFFFSIVEQMTQLIEILYHMKRVQICI